MVPLLSWPAVWIQVTPPSVLRKIPSLLVPARRSLGSEGSTAIAVTATRVVSGVSSDQVAAESVLRKMRPASVPA